MSREKRISTYLFVAWFFERKTKKKWITSAAFFLLYLRFVFIEGLYWRCVVGKDVHLYLNMFETHFDRTQIQMWYDTNQVNKTIHYLCRPCTRVVHFMFVWNPIALTPYTNYKKTIVMIHNVTVIGTETWRRQPSVTCKQEHSVIGSS